MDKFQKNNWSWQLEQLQQRIGEWLDVKLRLAAPKQGLPPWVASLIGYLLWSVLIAGIAWVLYLIVSRYWPNLQLLRLAKEPAAQPVRSYTVAELMAQVQRFQNERNYSEACRYLYLAMLQRLNDAKLIPHQTSRTDREYAELLRNLPMISNSTVLLQTHEQFKFADRIITADGFDRCQRAYSQLDVQLQNQAEPGS